MKMKNEEEQNEDFFGRDINIELILFRIFELRLFRIRAQFPYVSFKTKVTFLQREVKTAKSGSTLKGYSL